MYHLYLFLSWHRSAIWTKIMDVAAKSGLLTFWPSFVAVQLVKTLDPSTGG